jgi:hypothetical protein
MPCGSLDCYLDVDNKCKSNCMYSEHYIGSNGKCILKSCSERRNNHSEEKPCGYEGNENGQEQETRTTDECFLDVNNEYKCVSRCSDEFHYEGKNGICVPKVCSVIEANENSEENYQCGYNCVYDGTKETGNK